MQILTSISTKDKILFARYLSLMLKAGIPLLEGLIMVQKQIIKKPFVKILDKVIKDVRNGQFLATSLAGYSAFFDNFFINIIRIGESSGTLSENLNYLVEELTKKTNIRRKVISALIYPIVILLVTFGITGFLTIFIFPKILPVLKSLNVALPLGTRILIGLSLFISSYGIFVVLAVLLMFIIGAFLLRIKRARSACHFLLLKIPFLNFLIRAYTIANFSRTLGILLKSGVPIVEALNITSASISNLVYQKQFYQMVSAVKRGSSLASYMKEQRRLFPVSVSALINVGENTGNLADTLFIISDFYEAELDDVTKNLSSILEPALMILMGVMVGFVAISIITPIYKISQAIRR